MIRLPVIAAVLALGIGAPAAQDAAPPATADIVVDPAASLNTTPKQTKMLTGFYATMAVIDICAITLDPEITTGMAADKLRLEAALGMNAAMAETAYAQVKADVASTAPDCAEGSADRLGVDAVTAIYAALPAAEPAPAPAPVAGTVTAEPPAAPTQ